MTQNNPNTPSAKAGDGRQRLVLVTGPSGAGRSTAIRALEDIGFETIDNLPLSLLPRLLQGPPLSQPLALGIDVRNRDFSPDTLIKMIDTYGQQPSFLCQMLYLDASEDTLLRRYSETRRRHPLALDDSPLSGIRREKLLLGTLRNRAHVLIETSELSPHDLRREVEGWFGTPAGRTLSVEVQSFSYKRGLPRALDFVFDCRFLRNPHWEPNLRIHDGRNKDVAAYIAQDPLSEPFFQKVRDLVLFVLPASRDEGKSYISVGFGCTGGKHRSVAMAEQLAKALTEASWPVTIRHRELDRLASAKHGGVSV
ncbi:MAG: RNase adapter RapZ [Rhodobacteraceae bacterium]|nr:RNase adapter RapZ [Paracoccaceae bacterium]